MGPVSGPRAAKSSRFGPASVSNASQAYAVFAARGPAKTMPPSLCHNDSGIIMKLMPTNFPLCRYPWATPNGLA
jgi:hypothetical protein